MLKILGSPKTLKITAIGAFAVIIILIGFGQVNYNDFWWHLSLGKWMLANHSFLTHDIFSYTFNGKLWLNSTWMFDGLIYLIYSSTGFFGLNILRVVLLGLTYVVFYRVATVKKNVSPLLALGLLLLTLTQLRNFIRPELTQPLFIGFFLLALYRFKYYRSKLIYLLPLVIILWTNTHGSFSIGLVLICIFIGSEIVRAVAQKPREPISAIRDNKMILPLSMILLLSSAATLINPYGFHIYALIHAILADKESLANVNEWVMSQPIRYLSFTPSGIVPFVSMVWLSCGLLGYKAIRSIRDNQNIKRILARFPYEDLLLWLFIGSLFISHVRFTYLFFLVSAVLLTKNSSTISLKGRHVFSTITFLISIFIVVFDNTNSLSLNAGPSEFVEPRESTAFVRGQKISGAMLNDYTIGSELTWQLFPDYKVFIDGRTPNLYDNEFYWFFRYIGNERILKKLESDYNLQFAVSPFGSGMSQTLSSSADWALLFFDNYASIYVRRTDQNKKLITDHEYFILKPQRPDTDYPTYCNDANKKAELFREINRSMQELNHPVYAMTIAATMLTECDDHTLEDTKIASELLRKAITYRPTDATLLFKYGKTLIDLDMTDQAIHYFKLSKKMSNSAAATTGLGIALHNQGKYREAEKYFQKVPFLPGLLPNEFYQVYGRIEYQLDHNTHAISLFKRYIALIDSKKITKQDYLDLANAYHDNGDIDRAKEYAAKAETIK